MSLLVLALSAGPVSAQTPCVGGDAGGYPCDAVDLMSRLPLSTFAVTGSGAPSAGNDIWGWTDPTTGSEYALVGTTNGTAFVDVTDPAAPVFLGKLPTQTSSSSWRDIKTIGDYAYIVSEASGHGIQVFDLTRLRAVASPPATFTADAVYTGIGKAHNIVVIDEADLVIAVGANQGGYACNAGGLHMVDVSTPRAPIFAGCYDGDGYTHDAQCLTYAGPDADHTGAAICVASNEDTVTVIDVTTPAAAVQLSRTFYPNPSYTHQGWFDQDQRYFIVNDETDGNNSTPTRTIVMDLLDLDAPDFSFFHDGTTAATDHNLYVVGTRVFQSNYTAGLQILDAAAIGSGALSQVAFFDTYPSNNGHSFNGQWSNYPYFASGNVIASDIQGGLFVLAPQPPQAPPQATLTPDSIDETVAPTGVLSVPVTVANGAGGGDLNYVAELQNLSQPFARPPAARPAALVGADGATEAEGPGVSGRPSGVDPALAADDPARREDGGPGAGSLGTGGPDAFGYAWADSDEPDGPAVDFQSISGTGAPVAFTATGSFPAGDEGYADVALPFAFPFYGDSKTTVRVFSNGFMTFDAGLTGSTFENGGIPASGTPNDMIAPFWDDLDQSAGGATYTGTLPDGRFVVQFDGVARYNDGGSSLTFQAILSADGGIEFQYGTMTASTLAGASVGIEDAAGAAGLPVAVNAAYLASHKAVRFVSPVVWATLSGATSGTVAPGGDATFSVDLDAAALPEGVYTAEVVVSTNDPVAGTLTVPVTLTVEDDGGISIVIDTKGFSFLGTPSPGLTVDDLAAQNLVRGVPGYYPNAEPAYLHTAYDATTASWSESTGTGEVLEPGRAFRWRLTNRVIGNPDISRSVGLPFTLTTDRPANTADVTVELQTGGSRMNYLANPFADDLDLTGIYGWPGGSNVPPSGTQVWTYDPALRTFTAAPPTVPAWMGFRVRSRGPGSAPRLLTIPASAALTAGARRPEPPSARATPALRFVLDGVDADGARVADRSFEIVFSDEAQTAFDADEDVAKFQVPAESYALVGSRVGPAFLGVDVRPFAPAEIPVAVEARGTGPAFTLRWDASALPAGLPVVLVDLATGREVDVRASSSVAFEAAPLRAFAEAEVPLGELADGASATDRFVLRIGTLTSVETDISEVALTAISPNPSTGSARVSFAVPEAGAARLSVVDVRGREVAVLVDGPVSAGRHEATLSSGSLAAGVYVVRLEAAGTVVTRQAVVVR